MKFLPLKRGIVKLEDKLQNNETGIRITKTGIPTNFPTPNFPKHVYRHQIFRNKIFRHQIFRQLHFPTVKFSE